jgi:hypothetical protein
MMAVSLQGGWARKLYDDDASPFSSLGEGTKRTVHRRAWLPGRAEPRPDLAFKRKRAGMK